MKLHGYPTGNKPPDEVVPAELAEVTLEASARELRAIAWFLTSVANQMDTLGSAFNHAHLSDVLPEFSESPHLVVFKLPASPSDMDLEEAKREFEKLRSMLGGGDGPKRA